TTSPRQIGGSLRGSYQGLATLRHRFRFRVRGESSWVRVPAAWPLLLARLGGVADYYRAPGWFTRNVFNQLVAFLTRQGISVLGSRVLAVKGRTSGQWRTTPVNLLS